MTHPIFGADSPADQALADFGVALAIPSAPTVTRGVLKTTVESSESARAGVVGKQRVLKVKADAFGDLPIAGARVTVTHHSGAQEVFTIDTLLPREESGFDYYALQPYRPRVGA